MVEVKESHGNFIMIEANPRMWVPSQLIVDADTGFFEAYLRDMGFLIKESKPIMKSDIYYYWEGGIPDDVETIRYYSYSFEEYNRDYSKLLCCDVFNRDDTRELFRGK